MSDERVVRIHALPLGEGGFSGAELDEFLSRRRIRSDALPLAIAKAVLKAAVGPGDVLLLMENERPRAVGLVVGVSDSSVEWLQIEIDLDLRLAAPPKYGAYSLLPDEVRRVVEELVASAAHPIASLRSDPIPPVGSREMPTHGESIVTALPETLGGTVDTANIILYGPPGTGKTFSTARRALQLLRVEGVARLDDETCARYFRQFQVARRVEFVTFHQSYGYEEFVEGLRPVLKSSSGEVQYELHQGVFARIAQRAREAFERPAEDPAAPAAGFEPAWNALRRRISEAGGSLAVKSASGQAGEMTLEEDAIRVRIDPDDLARKDVIRKDFPVRKDVGQRLWEQRGALGARSTTSALGAAARGALSGHYLHPLYHELIAAAPLTPQVPIVPQFVLVIDEINRGNISKILGELITLIEPDKRLGCPSELRLPLTYSPDKLFGLPPNLHILGTMNTADRSIALLDIALRRRFTFEGLMPDPSVIPTVVTHPDLGPLAALLLRQINRRIRFLLDEDHQVGHAFFLHVTSYEDLRDVFVHRVIPLLHEYFHGSPDSVCAVLGCPYDAAGKQARKDPDAGKAPMLAVEPLDEKTVLGFDHPDFPDIRLTFAVSPGFRTGAGTSLIPFFLDVLVRKDLSAADAALIARLSPQTA